MAENGTNGSRTNGKAAGEVGPGKPPVEHQFKPGNPGRQLGSRNKLGEAFIADLFADWQENGIATIKAVREERPHEYLKVVASILPKTLDVNLNKYDQMSDDELIARIRQLDAVIRPFLAVERAGGADGASAEKVRH